MAWVDLENDIEDLFGGLQGWSLEEQAADRARYFRESRDYRLEWRGPRPVKERICEACKAPFLSRNVRKTCSRACELTMRDRAARLRVTYGGRTQSLAAWCKELGIPYPTAAGRIRRGETPENVLANKHRPEVWCVFRGEKKRLGTVCRELGVPMARVHFRLKFGWDLERALLSPVVVREKKARSPKVSVRRSPVQLTLRGRTLRISQWAKVSGIPERTISKRLQRGWDAESAVFSPKVIGRRKKKTP